MVRVYIEDLMKNKTQVVVIGGGVVGAGTLYHLAKKGWTDVVLVERKDLTSGSTWHAAGLLPLFNMSYSVGKLHQYSVDFYHELEKETGMNVGFSVVSNIRLANSQDRMDEYKYYAGVGSTVGVNVNFLTPEEIKEVWEVLGIKQQEERERHARRKYQREKQYWSLPSSRNTSSAYQHQRKRCLF